MPSGICGMCHQAADLQNSHLIPASLYQITSPGEHPVIMAGGSAIFNSRQVTAHLLCAECEDRFSRNGEQWIAENCWHSESEFPLRSALAAAPPLVREPGFYCFEGRSIPGVDVDRLVYFAASVFWRASVHKWTVSKRDRFRLSLGPQEEGLRRYLLGEAAFPDDVALLVTVHSRVEQLFNRTTIVPVPGSKTSTHRHFSFAVPGVHFILLTGRGLPPSFKRQCTARHGYIYVAQINEQNLVRMMLNAVKNNKARGKLRRDDQRDGIS